MPAAEVEVTPALVRRLLTTQHPDLAHLPVTLMANGWDNVIFRLGTDLIARLPRRELGASLIAHEQKWLPVLAPALPLPVPAPVRISKPAGDYPWPWSVVPFLPGHVAAEHPPADPAVAAASLGRFLAALHVPAPQDAPANAFRGIPLAGRDAVTRAGLVSLGDLIDQQAAEFAWRSALAIPTWDGDPVWLHGDLHPANILVHQGEISGVIDFGDLTSGDPATDLAVAWMMFGAAQRDMFRDAYAAAARHSVGADLWARAMGWALALGVVMLAHSADNPLIAGVGRRTVRAVLASSAAPSR